MANFWWQKLFLPVWFLPWKNRFFSIDWQKLANPGDIIDDVFAQLALSKTKSFGLRLKSQLLSV